jgi:branched-chain amino acid transport system permease protein
MIVGAAVCAALAVMTCRMEMFVLKLVTLAFGEAVVVLAFNIEYLGGANSFTGITLHTNSWNSLALAIGALLVALSMDRSPIGYIARATRDDALAAAAMGVSIRGIRTLTFMVSGAIIGIAGALQAHYILVMNPHDLSFFISLSVVIFLLFGGVQSVWGAILGAALLTVLPEALRFTNEFRHILFGALIVAIVMLRPSGLITRRPLEPNSLPNFSVKPAIKPAGIPGKTS